MLQSGQRGQNPIFLAMFALVRAFADIALRRKGPQDLPASRFLLAATVLAYLLSQLPAAILLPGSLDRSLLVVLADALLIGLSLAALLWLTGWLTRYLQTATAVFGTSALLSVMTFPFYLWRAGLGDAQLDMALPTAAILMILVWSFIVGGHILAEALSKPFVLGLIIAIAYFFVHMNLLFLIVPASE